MKIADCHMHSFFSSDSEAPTEEMVKRAVELGLPAICLTDHYDMDYSTGEFQLDTGIFGKKPGTAGKILRQNRYPIRRGTGTAAPLKRTDGRVCKCVAVRLCDRIHACH